METKETADDIFGPPISSYSRSDAIADGLLVDVSDRASEYGIRFRTAVTRAVWANYVEVPNGATCQDESGRLNDILWMFRCALSRNSDSRDTLFYQLHVRTSGSPRPSLVTLKAICGPGDDTEPVVTILMPDED